MTASRDAENWRPAPWPSAEERAEIARFGLDRPTPDIDPRLVTAADALGVELLPWQVEVGTRVLNGERFFDDRGRKSGTTTLRRVLAIAETLPAPRIDDVDGMRRGVIAIGLVVVLVVIGVVVVVVNVLDRIQP